jgi:preprotein translocase subunit SecE
VAKYTMKDFFRQVRTEARKVTWPTRSETVQSTIMVMIMAGLMALFFFAVDRSLAAAMQWIFKLMSGQ